MLKYTTHEFYSYEPNTPKYIISVYRPRSKKRYGWVVQYDRIGLWSSGWIKRAKQYETLNQAVGVAMKIKRNEPKARPAIYKMLNTKEGK